MKQNVYGSINHRLSTFYFGQFVKCFGLDMQNSNMQDIKYVTHYFKSDPIVQSFMSSTYVVVHGPQQLFLSNGEKILSFDANETYGGGLGLQIGKPEVLKSRNKPTNHCMTEWKNWDELVTMKRYKDIGCFPPYYEPRPKFKMCSTTTEIKRWSNVMVEIRNNRSDQPCQQMPKIDFEVSTVSDENWNVRNGEFTISIGYPEQMKIITQSRAVDSNTLIGNIGGYIGLFLGTLTIEKYCSLYF